jgi:hypothetical protein
MDTERQQEVGVPVPRFFQVGRNPFGLATADFDGDGVPDWNLAGGI